MSARKVDLWGESVKRRRHVGPSEIEHVPTVDRCPRCGATVHEQTIRQDALLRHGGHGATEKTVTRSCGCGWSLTVEVSEERPPRRAGATGEQP